MSKSTRGSAVLTTGRKLIGEGISFVIGCAAVLVYWYLVVAIITDRAVATGKTGSASTTSFWPLLLLSCVLFGLSFRLTHWLLRKTGL